MATVAELKSLIKNIAGVQTFKIWTEVDMENTIKSALSQIEEDINDSYFSNMIASATDTISTDDGAHQDIIVPNASIRKLISFQSNDPWTGATLSRPWTAVDPARLMSIQAANYPITKPAELGVNGGVYSVSLSDTSTDSEYISTFPILQVGDSYKIVFYKPLVSGWATDIKLAQAAVLPLCQLVVSQLLLFQSRGDLNLSQTLYNKYLIFVQKVNDDYTARLGVGSIQTGSLLRNNRRRGY